MAEKAEEAPSEEDLKSEYEDTCVFSSLSPLSLPAPPFPFSPSVFSEVSASKEFNMTGEVRLQNEKSESKYGEIRNRSWQTSSVFKFGLIIELMNGIFKYSIH